MFGRGRAVGSRLQATSDIKRHDDLRPNVEQDFRPMSSFLFNRTVEGGLFSLVFFSSGIVDAIGERFLDDSGSFFVFSPV